MFAARIEHCHRCGRAWIMGTSIDTELLCTRIRKLQPEFMDCICDPCWKAREASANGKKEALRAMYAKHGVPAERGRGRR